MKNGFINTINTLFYKYFYIKLLVVDKFFNYFIHNNNIKT
jgi:hypothetical protein